MRLGLAAIGVTWSLVLSVAAWAQPGGAAPPSGAAALRQTGGILLRIKRAPEQTLRYRATVTGGGEITAFGESQKIVVSGGFARVERTLSEVKPGTWEVRITIEQPTLTFRAGTDQQTLTMQVPPLTEVVNDRGEVAEVRGWDPSQIRLSSPGMGEAVRPLFGLIQEQGLPEGAVQPGAKWAGKARLKTGATARSGEPPAPAGASGADQELEQRFEFIGFREVGGVQCAAIRATADLPVRRKLPPNAMGMQVSVDGTQRIETVSLLAWEQGTLLRQQTTIGLDFKTTTVRYSQKPDETVPGSISLRVAVTMDLQG